MCGHFNPCFCQLYTFYYQPYIVFCALFFLQDISIAINYLKGYAFLNKNAFILKKEGLFGSLFLVLKDAVNRYGCLGCRVFHRFFYCVFCCDKLLKNNLL
ncbi:hypothetical protein IA57_03635 [Mangrovimonas yunxiaonensis]|uniref:Uncharacterized protein n=1 Tax=Mangrovimonas yunxiaonensis TaxID=1197477 RepID=A0A084TMN1_9FLAO|nr:hypothetical protein IA57_03635 [Mangrovimonas yunxiaonensis]